MELLNGTRLISIWQDSNNRLLKEQSRSDTEWIIQYAVGEALVEHVYIGPKTSKATATAFYHWKRGQNKKLSHKSAATRVNRVFKELNHLPRVEATLVPTSVKANRPTAYPLTPRQMVLAEHMIAADQHLLSWCQQTHHKDATLLVFALRMMQRLGMSSTVVIGTLAALTLEHVQDNWLSIPAAPGEPLEGGHYRIKLPSSIGIVLRRICTASKKGQFRWLFAISRDCDALDHRQKAKVLTKRLRRVSQKALKELRNNVNSERWKELKSWASLSEACQYTCVLRGLAPTWGTLLQQYPLPTCTPMPLTLDVKNTSDYLPGAPKGRLPSRSSKHQTIMQPLSHPDIELGETTQPPGVMLLNTDNLPIDWSARARSLIRKFLSAVSRTGKKRVNTAKLRVQMRELLETYDEKMVSLIGHPGSYPQWVLHYCYYKLCSAGDAVSSVSNEVSLLTPITMMLDTATLDLSDWNDETIIDLQIAADEGGKWGEKTRRNFISSLRTFIRFCQDHGILEDVSLPRQDNSPLSPSTLRTRIVTPDHFQTVWHDLTLTSPDGDPRQMMALTIALGFYGGLRASEVLSLTLNDVVIDISPDPSNHCWVEILDGKSDNARRRVALHIMAPTDVIEIVRRWITIRRQRFSDHKLSDISLFGPPDSANAYTYSALITPVIAYLRDQLGEDIDFHGLRHAAVSWTLLRLHAAQNENFVSCLVQQQHWMFFPDVLDRTLKHFCEAEGVDTLNRGTLWLQVAKWIGHGDSTTMLKHYAHVLGIIHSDILLSNNSIIGVS